MSFAYIRIPSLSFFSCLRWVTNFQVITMWYILDCEWVGGLVSNQRSPFVISFDVVSITWGGNRCVDQIEWTSLSLLVLTLNWMLGPYLISAKLECMQIMCSQCSQLAIIRNRSFSGVYFNKGCLLHCYPVASLLHWIANLHRNWNIYSFNSIFDSFQSFSTFAFYHHNRETVHNNKRRERGS